MSLQSPGTLYALLIESEFDLATTPTPFQIANHLDQVNNRHSYVFSNHTMVHSSQKESSLLVSQLKSNVYYNAYLVSGGDQPGYPQLMASSEVKVIKRVLTAEYIKIIILDINTSCLLRLSTLPLLLIALVTI